MYDRFTFPDAVENLMRQLRWKQNFLSGVSSLDRPKQALYEDLRELLTEMGHREHCQDMEDLMDELNQEARNLFEVKAGNSKQAEVVIREHTASIAQTLGQHLPLHALDTPACHHCEICDYTAELVGNWLEQSVSANVEKNENVAA